MKIINLQMERLKREQKKVKNVAGMTLSEYIDILIRNPSLVPDGVILPVASKR